MLRTIVLTLFILSPVAHAEWKPFVFEDPMTDVVSKGAMVDSINIQDNRRATLVAFCKAGELKAYVTNVGYFSGQGFYDVMWRVDKNKPVTEKWHGDSSNDILRFSDFLSMIDDFKSGGRYLLRAKRDYANHVDYEFSLAGFKEAFSDALNECKSEYDKYSIEKKDREIRLARSRVPDPEYVQSIVDKFSVKK